jgi:hypothetical protein
MTIGVPLVVYHLPKQARHNLPFLFVMKMKPCMKIVNRRRRDTYKWEGEERQRG